MYSSRILSALILNVACCLLARQMSYAALVVNGGFETSEELCGDPSNFCLAEGRQPGDWGGDLSEIVGAENGITPFEGESMLSFLATGPDGPTDFNNASDMSQFIDVSPFAQEIADGQEFRVSAFFNRIAGDEDTDTEFLISINNVGEIPLEPRRFDERMMSDADPSTWEQLTFDFVPPEGTNTLWLRVRAKENTIDDDETPEFHGHYVDAVTVNLVADLATCDLNSDGNCDGVDIDFLSRQIREGLASPNLDLDMNGTVEPADRDFWVHDEMNTYFGDSNLDGEFNSTDLIAVFQAGEYEDQAIGNSMWTTGDWNGDGEFDTGDLVLAFQDGGFEQGPRLVANAVPEPSSLIVLAIGMVGLCRFRRCR